jgi:hypothetical protein
MMKTFGGWNCGFYPGSHPGECTSGTAATFAQARADFGGVSVKANKSWKKGRYGADIASHEKGPYHNNN